MSYASTPTESSSEILTQAPVALLSLRMSGGTFSLNPSRCKFSVALSLAQCAAGTDL
jgi:hypothetical protein